MEFIIRTYATRLVKECCLFNKKYLNCDVIKGDIIEVLQKALKEAEDGIFEYFDMVNDPSHDEKELEHLEADFLDCVENYEYEINLILVHLDPKVDLSLTRDNLLRYNDNDLKIGGIIRDCMKGFYTWKKAIKSN